MMSAYKRFCQFILYIIFILLMFLILLIMQGNARRLLDKRCDGNSWLGKFSKLGLAPVLWCMIIILLSIYVHSVVTGILL